MIKKLNIKNFRSILSSSVNLEHLTVIVGANATGKSNLIKSIDFISDMAESGLQDAIYKRGGINEILPKQLRNVYDQEILIELEFELEPPKNWNKRGLPPLLVSYLIGFTKTKRSSLKIISESLKTKSILLLAKYLEKDLDEKEDLELELDEITFKEYEQSQIEFYRDSRQNIQYSLNFKLTKENNFLFLSWLGFRDFFRINEKPLSVNNTKRILKSLVSTRQSGYKKSELPILSNNRAIFGFNSHFRKIITEVQSYGRYDLLINELRQEQSISSESTVSITGDNIPSVIKKFIKNNKKGWQRVLTTMSNISPYFSNVYSESLRAGKEYLVFKEVFGGRNIEAWESSDGTLRALAILISIETHRSGSTLLIEEPEHGLHPWAIKELMLHIRNVLEERNLQVIITTHSQQVLENIRKEELLITERDEEGTKYSSVNQIIPDADISMGEVGELWTRGLLKGVPTSF
ncbi:AAA family ATPase [Winogradskyella sp.]|uniref:AAA family ATPase n=1 Tax=Winogradskyella sp. TaxID=1883156 RepID=UPI003AA86DE3